MNGSFVVQYRNISQGGEPIIIKRDPQSTGLRMKPSDGTSTSTTIAQELCHCSRAHLSSEQYQYTAMFGLTQSINCLTTCLLKSFRGLVLGCIEAEFCNYILVGKLLTRYIGFTFFAHLRSKKISNFSLRIL